MFESPQHFEQQIWRMRYVTGAHSELELATYLGISKDDIDEARKKNEVPASWIVTLFQAQRVLPEWILTGASPQKLPKPNYYPTEQDLAMTHLDVSVLQNFPSEVLAAELVRRSAVTHYKK